MLRITRTGRDGEPIRLALEGRLTRAEIGALEAACGECGSDARRLVLDLAGVRFADADGVAALRRLSCTDAVIANPTPFVAELLEREEGS